MAAAFALACAAWAGAAADPPSARAARASREFLANFWDGGAGRFRECHPPDGRFNSYWQGAHALDAVLDALERTERGGRRDADLRRIVAAFHDSQARRGWRVAFFDDMAWMTIALARAHTLTGEPRYLATARALMDDIMANGWDPQPLGPLAGGGVWWDRPHTQKATAANAGAALAAARLHRITGDARYRAFAVRVYDAWRGGMVNGDTGEVADHVTTAGTVTRWKFTYNEGLMLGAAWELARGGGKDAPRFRRDAALFARRLATAQTVRTKRGPVLSDGTTTACGGDCHQFKGIAFRYLALYWREAGRPRETGRVLRASAESIWQAARAPRTGTFGVDWSSPPPPGPSTLAQNSSAVMALEAWAGARD